VALRRSGKYSIASQQITRKFLNCNYLQLYPFFTINSPVVYGAVRSSKVNLPAPANLAQGDFVMHSSPKSKILALAFVSACLLVATAHAGCGDSKTTLRRQSLNGLYANPASPQLVADSTDPIVGMWHVTFTAQGNEVGPPDGALIDNALVTWHSDGTELMNSARPPQDGDFCMGVWKKTGKNTYKLNHFAWLANDTANAPGGIGNPSGPARIFAEITLSPDGKHYTGKFTLDAYDTLGNPVAHIVGVVDGTRITLDTTVGDLL
jgi:hypothetical protein